MSDTQPVYVLLTMKVEDPAMLSEYLEKVTPLMVDAGMELLSAGTDTVTTLEGDWDHQRVALMRAPSRDAFFAFYDSEAYATTRLLRRESTESMMAVLDGISFDL